MRKSTEKKETPQGQTAFKVVLPLAIGGESASFAEQSDIELVDGAVRVIIECVPGQLEAATERLETKREIFSQLNQVCPGHTILATNSSSIRISRIEDATHRPDRVLNAHFYGSIWQNTVVELMRGTATSDKTIELDPNFTLAYVNRASIYLLFPPNISTRVVRNPRFYRSH